MYYANTILIIQSVNIEVKQKSLSYLRYGCIKGAPIDGHQML